MSTSRPLGRAPAGTTLLYTGVQHLNAVIVNTDGTNAGRCVLYDNGAGVASGKILADIQCTGAALNNGIFYNISVFCESGITAVVTGTNATADVYAGGV